MHKIVSALFLCLCLHACSNAEKDKPTKLESINWILGYWEMSSPDGTVTESWIRTNDTSYSGVGKFLDSAGKMLTTEEIQIVLRNDELWYIPSVSNQNEGQPVSFKEASFSDTMVVFENKEHNFPQRIVYVKKSDSSVLAYIEGDVNGEHMRIDYPYLKQ